MSFPIEAQTYRLGDGRNTAPALGRALARADMSSFVGAHPPRGGDQIVLIDFGRIPETNSSYVERTLLWAIDAGRAFAGDDPRSLLYLPDSDDAVIPAPVFPIAIGCSDDVVEEIKAATSKTGRIAMVATDHDRPSTVRLIGDLERALRETLDRLCSSKGLSAGDFHDLTLHRGISGGRDVGVNVWHNRLASLHRLRLACRVKDSRQWRYFAVASEVFHG